MSDAAETEEADPFFVVAKFEDPVECDIAAGALRAAGFDVLQRTNDLAMINFMLRRATGGFGLLVPRSQGAEVRAFLRERNPVNAEAANWKAHPAALTGAPIALLAAIAAGFEPVLGWLIASARREPTPLKIIVATLIAASFVAVIFCFSFLNG